MMAGPNQPLQQTGAAVRLSGVLSPSAAPAAERVVRRQGMTSFVRRLSVVGPCLLLGAFCVGWYAVMGCPSAWGWGSRIEAWAYMLT